MPQAKRLRSSVIIEAIFHPDYCSSRPAKLTITKKALLFVRKRVLLPPPAAEYRDGADTARPPLPSDTPPRLERVSILALYESNANGGPLPTFTGSGASAPFSVVLRDVLEDDMVLLS